MKPAALFDHIRSTALELPETDEAHPWGENAVRVREKAFVFMRLEKDQLSFSFKLPESGKSALALPFAQPTHYGMGRHGWVTFTNPPASAKFAKQCDEWIRESYRAVAPKRLAKTV
jgi:predicted DNA-binding protein (MmcQ/YjbR family)